MRPFLFVTVTLLILTIDRGASIKVTRELLPHFKYHCDPGDPSSASKCRGKTKYGLKEGFGFQRETQKNNIFCLKFEMCANYAYGTMMLAIRSAWDSTGMLGKTDRRFPSDLIASFVRSFYFPTKFGIVAESWYNRPDTKKTLKQIREEEREEKAEAAARAAAAAAAASTTAASATKTETSENVSDVTSESTGDKIFRDEPVSEDYTPETEADIGSTSSAVQEPMDVGPVPSALPLNALRVAIHSWRH
ncbi:hypothetical protein Aduo_010317 [Ancylostoma duodenale]